MSFEITGIADSSHHRNGIGGGPFDVVIFNAVVDGVHRTMVAVLFEDRGECAVFDMDMLAKHDIAFGSNSWRGGQFEPEIRKALEQKQRKEDAGEFDDEFADVFCRCCGETGRWKGTARYKSESEQGIIAECECGAVLLKHGAVLGSTWCGCQRPPTGFYQEHEPKGGKLSHGWYCRQCFGLVQVG